MSSTFTLAEVSSHNNSTDLWIIVNDEVYDVTDFQKNHPGGEKILNKYAGKDATKPFMKLHNVKILKTGQYIKLCIGKVEDGEQAGKKLTGWKKMVSSLKGKSHS